MIDGRKYPCGPFDCRVRLDKALNPTRALSFSIYASYKHSSSFVFVLSCHPVGMADAQPVSPPGSPRFLHSGSRVINDVDPRAMPDLW